MGKNRETAIPAVGNFREMDFPAVGNFREFGGDGLQKCPRMVSVFFANSESEAAAAKGARFGSTQTAFPAQKIPSAGHSGRRDFAFLYSYYVFPAFRMTTRQWPRFRLLRSRCCPFSRRTVPDIRWKCAGLGACTVVVATAPSVEV